MIAESTECVVLMIIIVFPHIARVKSYTSRATLYWPGPHHDRCVLDLGPNR